MTQVRIVDPEGYFPHMHNLPEPEAIAALETDARWDEVPEEYRITEFHARGHNEVFAGREEEMARLLTAFAPRDSVSDRTNHQTMLMYGAQGSGKSSLLEELARAARNSGVAVIHLHRTAFKSKAEFVAQLTSSKVWRAATKLQRARQTILNVAGSTVTQTAAVALQLEAAKWGVGDTLSQWNLVVGAARMDTSPPADPAEALRRLDDAFAGGFMITVDEVQHWAAEIGNADLTYLVNLAGDPTERFEGAEIRSGGLLLAGLADSVDILKRLNITRVDYMRLGALERDDADDILREHLAYADVDAEVRREVEARWCMTMANQFHTWPHHTICAARAMVRALEEMRREWQEDGYPTPDGQSYEQQLDWVRTVAARGVSTLYEDRWSDAKRAVTDQLVPEIIALAKQQDNQVHEDAIRYLIEVHTEEQQPKLRRPVDNCLVDILHSGLLEPILNNRHAPTSYMRVPIPSMGRYIAERSQLPVDQARVASAAAMTPLAEPPPKQ